jgi:hypothetical protein
MIVALSTWMTRANRSERRHMERRRQEWIARGRIPEEEPRFFSGDFGGGSKIEVRSTTWN